MTNDTPLPRSTLRELRSITRRAVKRLSTKLEKQQAELAAAKQFDMLRGQADMLLAMAHEIPRGTREYELTNANTGEQETVRLNPKLDAHGNAELLYRKARKSQRGEEVMTRNVEHTSRDLRAAEAVLGDIDEALGDTDADDSTMESTVETTRSRLQKLGVLPRQRQTGTGREEDAVPFTHVRFDGYDIYIGRNDTQNDELTVHFARPWDLWLHVAVHAGSHVVIRRERKGGIVPDGVQAAAAALAAWFSKARHAGSVEVHIAEKRYVHKRRRAPAGEVHLQQYRTLRVNPLSPQELFKRLGA